MRAVSHLATLAAFAAALAGCSKHPQAASKPEEAPKPVATMTADKLIEEYKANEIAADQKYKEKLIQISGKVAEVKKAPILGYYIGLGSAQEGEMFDVMCYLDESAVDDAGKLQKGQDVKLMGICKGKSAGVVLTLRHCTIVK